MLRDLTQFPLADFLLELERRSVDIIIRGQEGQGMVTLKDGRLVDAEFAGRRGAVALDEIFALRAGQYELIEPGLSIGGSLDLETAEVVRRYRHKAASGKTLLGTGYSSIPPPPSEDVAEVIPLAKRTTSKGATLQGYASVPPPATQSQPTQPIPLAKRIGVGGSSLPDTRYSSAPPPAFAEERIPGTARFTAPQEDVRPLEAKPSRGPMPTPLEVPHPLEHRRQEPDTGPIPSSQLDPSALQQLELLHEAISGTTRSSSSPPESTPSHEQESPQSQTADQVPSPTLPRVGRYEVLVRLKSGGMGSIYLCRLSGSAGFQRLFAMKVLHQELVEKPEALDMFFSEARLLAQLHHPHIVGIVDVGTVDQPYLVLDYVEGGSLYELLRATSNVLEAGVALSIVLDALWGLSAAHQLLGENGEEVGIIHNDISPHNLLVGIDGTCRVADFGVANARGLSPEAIPRGRPSYIAPERLLQKPFDQRADIFSMGVVLYQALTGVDPFRGTTTESTLRNVLERPIEPPSEVGLRPPPALDWVCMKALARNPAERFRSAEEMANQLRRVAAREDLLVPPSAVAQVVRTALGPTLEARRAAAHKGLGAHNERSSMIPPRVPSIAPASLPPTDETEPPPSAEPREQTERLTFSARTTDERRRIHNITLYAVLALVAGALGLVILFPEKIKDVLKRQPPRVPSSEEAFLRQQAPLPESGHPGKAPEASSQPEVQLPPIEIPRDEEP